MNNIINLYSEKNGEIKKFLNLFYEKEINLENDLFWENSYETPIDMIEFISCFIDNKENFDINLWICIDNDIFINVTDKNLEEIIKYLYERF